MIKIQNQESVWDNIAEKWDKYRQVPSPSTQDFLKDKKGKILDLGCGSGRNFKAFNKNSEIYALDFSEKMLKHAKKNSKNIKTNLIKSESSNIPIKDSYFDSAICIALLHCIDSKEKRQKTLKEIYRVLKPSAQALISVWSRNSPRLKNQPKECFISWSSGLKNSEKRYTYIYDSEELEKELKQAGFNIIRKWQERNLNFIVEKTT